MSERRVFLWTAAALVAVVGLVWFGREKLFEKVEVEAPRPASGEALANRHLALGELLGEFGVPARTASSLEALPPQDQILWWLAGSRRVAPERLLDWVEGGGHLIFEPLFGEDPVAEAAGIGVFFEEDADEDDHLSAPEFQIDRPPWPKFYLPENEEVEVEVVGAEGELDAAWNLTVTYGEGMVTVLNSLEFLANEQISSKDHALLVWYLVFADEGRTGVTLVTRDPKPSVWLILGRRALPAAISLLVLAAVGLWAFARRVGPIQPSPSRDRRHLAEHLRASGEFLWQVGCEDVLLAAQRAAVSDQLARGGAHLGLGSESQRQKLLDEAKRAALRADLDAESVVRALKIRELRDRDRFADIVALLETLRRSQP